MRFQIVVCHPLRDSYAHALAGAAAQALTANGHGVELVDLYEENFEPALTARERQSYFQLPYDTASLVRYVEALRRAEGIVFCFPQWWYSMPAMLKGYIERVWAPGVAFEHQAEGGIRPLLTHVRVFGVITTYGSPWWVTRLWAGDPCRALMMRTLRPLCGRRVRSFYLAQYDLDRSTAASRAAFLERVRARAARL